MNYAVDIMLCKAIATCVDQNISPTAYLYEATFQVMNIFARVLSHSRPDFFGQLNDGESVRITMITDFKIMDHVILVETFNSGCYVIIDYSPEPGLPEVATSLKEILKPKISSLRVHPDG